MHAYQRTLAQTALRAVTRSVALLAILLAFAPSVTRAASLTVTSTADSGAGSLRQAIADAASGDTITFNLSGCRVRSRWRANGDRQEPDDHRPRCQHPHHQRQQRVLFQVSAGGNLNLSGVTIATAAHRLKLRWRHL